MDTYIDRRVPRAVLGAVLVVALVIVAVPSVGMLWARTESTTENRDLSPAPSLFEDDGSLNVNVLSDAGAYFDDHFAYRNEFVAANARIRTAFGTSVTDQVVVGADGWLYYGGTLPDYLGQSEMSERALRNVAHNLALTQAYVESQGAAFAFALAPNKNSLYPDHMPYYYVASPAPSNAQRLEPLLEEAGVNYADLFSLFEEYPGERYLKQDSHWDNRGALMATQKLLAALGREPLDLDVDDAVARDDFAGDLANMLYPVGSQPETNWYFAGYDDGEGMSGARWTYEEGENVTDNWVRTRSVAQGGSVLMFRDSFGNALVPFWASAFKSAAFSKLVPYNLPALAGVQADAVVIERAERHLDYLATNPPIMPAQPTDLGGHVPTDDVAEGAGTTMAVSEDGPYWKLEGALDDRIAGEDVRVYVSVEVPGAKPEVFDALWKTVVGDDGVTATDYGYQLHLSRDVLDLHGATVRVYAVDGGAPVCVKTFNDIA